MSNFQGGLASPQIYICTTTIYEPSEATKLFAQITDHRHNVKFVIAGDTKTPDEAYFELERQHQNVRYLSFEEQNRLYPSLCEVIPPKCIQRRNFAFLYASEQGADWIVTVDDDNIPYEQWASYLDILEGRQYLEVDRYRPNNKNVADPLSVSNIGDRVWHRGYPKVVFPDRSSRYEGKSIMKSSDFDVVAMLWDGDMDVDAICRVSDPDKSFGVKLETPDFFTFEGAVSVFNSQNTAFRASLLNYGYAMMPHAGRMDDIWPSYLVQLNRPTRVLFTSPTVYQNRNAHTLSVDIRGELIGLEWQDHVSESIKYRDGRLFVSGLPTKVQDFYDVWMKKFPKNRVETRVREASIFDVIGGTAKEEESE